MKKLILLFTVAVSVVACGGKGGAANDWNAESEKKFIDNCLSGQLNGKEVVSGFCQCRLDGYKENKLKPNDILTVSMEIENKINTKCITGH